MYDNEPARYLPDDCTASWPLCAYPTHVLPLQGHVTLTTKRLGNDTRWIHPLPAIAHSYSSARLPFLRLIRTHDFICRLEYCVERAGILPRGMGWIIAHIKSATIQCAVIQSATIMYVYVEQFLKSSRAQPSCVVIQSAIIMYVCSHPVIQSATIQCGHPECNHHVCVWSSRMQPSRMCVVIQNANNHIHHHIIITSSSHHHYHQHIIMIISSWLGIPCSFRLFATSVSTRQDALGP